MHLIKISLTSSSMSYMRSCISDSQQIWLLLHKRVHSWDHNQSEILFMCNVLACMRLSLFAIYLLVFLDIIFVVLWPTFYASRLACQTCRNLYVCFCVCVKIGGGGWLSLFVWMKNWKICSTPFPMFVWTANFISILSELACWIERASISSFK